MNQPVKLIGSNSLIDKFNESNLKLSTVMLETPEGGLNLTTLTKVNFVPISLFLNAYIAQSEKRRRW